MIRTKTATYLYCVVKAARRPSMARLSAGLTGATAPEVHQAGPLLWLIAAEVPLAMYGPPELESRLRDLDWVAGAALAHEGVVEHFARSRGATVIPAKLFTMFSSVDKAIADVSARRAEIVRVMKRVAGCEEWGIRITRNVVPAGTAASAHRPTSGSAFLAARKAARDAVVTARAEAAEAAAGAYRRLARLSRDAARRDKRQEPGTNPPILEAAFLVPVATRARFKAEAAKQARAAAAAGTSLTLTGPWPAYNFVETSS